VYFSLKGEGNATLFHVRYPDYILFYNKIIENKIIVKLEMLSLYRLVTKQVFIVIAIIFKVFLKKEGDLIYLK
jgi:hypothetical protein